jgi:hypothetical protein
MYFIDDDERMRLEKLPSDPELSRLKRIRVNLDMDREGQALVVFHVYVDLDGMDPMSPEARCLYRGVREEMSSRIDPDKAYDVRPRVHFLNAA